MNTQSNNSAATEGRNTGTEKALAIEIRLELEDWVETGWAVPVRRQIPKIHFSRNRVHRPDLTITIPVPLLSRALLSNQPSHLLVRRID